MVDKARLIEVLERAAPGRTSGVTVGADGSVGFVLAVDGMERGAATTLQAEVERAARSVLGVTGVRAILTAERGAAPAEPGKSIRHILAVASGKGGVGKSTVAANLAVSIAAQGYRVGLLDADIYGPSVPTLLGLEGRAMLENNRLQPMEAHGLKALSIGNMTDPDKAVVWRGPMAASAMTQMIDNADWGELDLLVIDLPPGTGDIQLTMAQKIKPDGAVIVSTPQDLALIDARKAISMFAQVDVQVLGLVENMSVFVCPHCGEASHIFGAHGAEEEAARIGVPFLGAIPLHASIREASDAGRPPATAISEISAPYREIATRVVQRLNLAAGRAS
ncbi:Mrp/NBP35 family ATP-binding protein [Sphingoaurantiacus capsulatus]|uniref:Iron-sulfur cluster carrier protein n=1 Tax=Sphingoaurantiacus capsulatus TaxID=1771310 RepID=A0ABV7X8K9_9SPHN